MSFSKDQNNQQSEAILAKISRLVIILDYLRKLLKLQTQFEKLQNEVMVRRVAKNYNVDVELLVAVIWAESGMNDRAITRNRNGTVDYGLCQFNNYWYSHIISPETALNNPELAVEIMCKMWEQGRQRDWIAYRNKSYIKYLNVKT